MNLINIFIIAFLTENVVLTKFLGICPFIGTSNDEKKAIGMGLTVLIITTISSVISYLIYKLILLPTKTTYLMTIMFILIIASLVQIAEIVIKNKLPKLYKSLGIYLPLVTTNCAVLGTVLLGISNDYNLIEVIIFSFGSSLGFTIILYIFSTIRNRLEKIDVPKSLKGYPIALITISMIALIFSRYI